MNEQAEIILHQALQLAERSDWEHVRLRDIAATMDVPLLTIYQYYPQKDDLVDAWFDQADRAMLACQQLPDFEHSSPQEKLLTAMMHWLNALAPHRNVTRQMLYYKLEPGHVHLQAAALLRISRTVQWLREIADLKADNLKRIEQELYLSALFSTGFIRWLTASEPALTAARNWFNRGLQLGRWRRLWH